MQNYIRQLLSDLDYSAKNVEVPFDERKLNIHDWLSEEEEERTAPLRNLQDWTGIRQEQLPPAEMLYDEQISMLLIALKNLLNAHNWSFVLPTEVPEQIQYACIRDNWNQQAKMMRWHMGFFEVCKTRTEHFKCTLGQYCQCAFYAELFSEFTYEELSPEEERARALEIEIRHLKRKNGDEWIKYYPYHLDANYDDEQGNPYDYGFGNGEENDENDDWWRK